MDETWVPKIRKEAAPFPAEHMRLIGEICVYWTAMEAMVLQAICEITDTEERHGMYLGTNVPVGTRFDLLQGLADSFKAHDDWKDDGKKLANLIQGMRDAYNLRNKYAHARLRTHGKDDDPDIHVARYTRRIEIETRPLHIDEMKKDADEIYDACTAMARFLQSRGLCRKAWS